MMVFLIQHFFQDPITFSILGSTILLRKDKTKRFIWSSTPLTFNVHYFHWTQHNSMEVHMS